MSNPSSTLPPGNPLNQFLPPLGIPNGKPSWAAEISAAPSGATQDLAKVNLSNAHRRAGEAAATQASGYNAATHLGLIDQLGKYPTLAALLAQVQPIVADTSLAPERIAQKAVASAYLGAVCEMTGVPNPLTASLAR